MPMTDKPGLNEGEYLALVERIQKAMCIEPFRPDVTDVVVLIGTVQVLNQENERLRAINGEAVARLTVIVEAFDGECRLDHHGFCQEHLVTKPCEILEARRFLASCQR